MMFVALILLGVAGAATLALSAFRDNVLYFYSPSDVTAGKVPVGRTFRVGGMVDKGSVVREPGSLEVKFVVTDFAHDVTVKYSGVLPDLFREGQGVIARGHLVDPQAHVFVADEVLAKHDEKYMPPEVAESLKKSHEAQRAAKGATT
jgi:cytochrome c-type biogenesis protein CcmE